MKRDINNITLPKDSRNTQLEIISKDYFRLLFDSKRSCRLLLDIEKKFLP